LDAAQERKTMAATTVATTTTATPILELQDVSLHFGGITALDGVGFSVNKGEIFAVIGPNGAGKTSVFNCISGLYHPAKGKILLDGGDITGFTPARRARLGLARSFQNIELFKGMTVIDNLMLGRHIHMKTGLLTGGVFFGPARREEIRNRKVVEEIVDFLEIQAIRQKVVGTLAYGLQKRVELGRALALQPRVLLLDEPMAGMNAEETEDMARFVLDINEERETTIVLIEHDMGVVMDICDRICAIDFGVKLAEGTPAEIQANPSVISAYLGETDVLFNI
jgi:branched-chain amino acid transport system ATP-binding protein